MDFSYMLLCYKNNYLHLNGVEVGKDKLESITVFELRQGLLNYQNSYVTKPNLPNKYI